MSLARKHASRSVGYRQGYLRSEAWAGFRRGFYRRLRAHGVIAACAGCSRTRGQGARLELHHLSYEGVSQGADGVWVSEESDDDVILLCSEHHEQLHRILDSNHRDFSGLDRRIASLRIINSFRARSARLTGSGSRVNTLSKRSL